MKYTKLFAVGLMTLGTIAFTSCTPEDVTSQNGTSTLKVSLTDGPGDYNEVNIDVQAVEVLYNDSMRTTLNAIQPGVYNILDFTNGLDTLIANSNVPSGHVNQIRLILGSNNTVMVDSVLHPLKTPSGQTSGLKVKFNYIFIDGMTYEVTLDFDAERSIVAKGNGGYSLKPVIRAIVDATSGSIEGYVQPDTAVSYTYVIHNTDTIGTVPDSTGYFRLIGLPAGSHDVNFTANAPYTSQVVNGVNVALGQITDIDTINF